jgi:xylose isomerase
MANLNFHHGVAQAQSMGKLFHIDLNAQRIGRFDQDFRFGSEGQRDAFYTVHLLESSGWDGMRHFDAHAYRTEDRDGVWDFARGCMRSYLILADKARRFDADPDIQEALGRAGAADLALAQVDWTDPAAVDAVRHETVDVDAAAARGYGNERLDQLVNELLLGVR